MPRTKVPQHAKRVFKGVIFDIHQWPQKMYDGSTRTFEIAKQKDTVLVIATVGEKIVVLKQRQPAMDWFYSIPAGRVDDGEKGPRQAAARELLEETGLKPRKMKLWKKMANPGKLVHNLYVFIAQDCVKVAEQALDGGEKIEVRYLSYGQFLKLAQDPHCYRGDILIDMLLATVNKTYRQELKQVIFG